MGQIALLRLLEIAVKKQENEKKNQNFAMKHITLFIVASKFSEKLLAFTNTQCLLVFISF